MSNNPPSSNSGASSLSDFNAQRPGGVGGANNANTGNRRGGGAGAGSPHLGSNSPLGTRRGGQSNPYSTMNSPTIRNNNSNNNYYRGGGGGGGGGAAGRGGQLPSYSTAHAFYGSTPNINPRGGAGGGAGNGFTRPPQQQQQQSPLHWQQQHQQPPPRYEEQSPLRFSGGDYRPTEVSDTVIMPPRQQPIVLPPRFDSSERGDSTASNNGDSVRGIARSNSGGGSNTFNSNGNSSPFGMANEGRDSALGSTRNSVNHDNTDDDDGNAPGRTGSIVLERQRQPYVAAAVGTVDDVRIPASTTTTATSIERQRQPYVAAGTGAIDECVRVPAAPSSTTANRRRMPQMSALPTAPPRPQQQQQRQYQPHLSTVLHDDIETDIRRARSAGVDPSFIEQLRSMSPRTRSVILTDIEMQRRSSNNGGNNRNSNGGSGGGSTRDTSGDDANSFLSSQRSRGSEGSFDGSRGSGGGGRSTGGNNNNIQFPGMTAAQQREGGMMLDIMRAILSGRDVPDELHAMAIEAAQHFGLGFSRRGDEEAPWNNPDIGTARSLPPRHQQQQQQQRQTRQQSPRRNFGVDEADQAAIHRALLEDDELDADHHHHHHSQMGSSDDDDMAGHFFAPNPRNAIHFVFRGSSGGGGPNNYRDLQRLAQAQHNLMQGQNIDDMSYEQLQQLCEQLGSVSTGLSDERIASATAPFYPLASSSSNSNSGNQSTDADSSRPSRQSADDGEERCPICLDNLKSQPCARILVCQHPFHKSCISKWLSQHPKCPVCMAEIPKQ